MTEESVSSGECLTNYITSFLILSVLLCGLSTCGGSNRTPAEDISGDQGGTDTPIVDTGGTETMPTDNGGIDSPLPPDTVGDDSGDDTVQWDTTSPVIPDEDYEADWEVNPLPGCPEVLAEQEGSRPRCDTVADRKIWTVGKDGGWDFDLIQDAIDAANHCDVIVVRPGVYQEYPLIDGKDLVLVSDIRGEDGVTPDGNEWIDLTAERLDLAHYYTTGEAIVEETTTAHGKVLRRALRTVITGRHEDQGLKVPMFDFAEGTTRNTVLDGFTLEFMPEQDHTKPGHAHGLECRGSSPVIRNNIIRHNGSTGVGIHASFKEKGDDGKVHDFRSANIEYRPTPLVIGNIVFDSNGLGLGNNHYSCAILRGNESFWNRVPGHPDHQSPGIGSRHGARTVIEDNIVYENGWGGITLRQGVLEGDPGKSVDLRTIAIVRGNTVYNNGAASNGAAGLRNEGDNPIEMVNNILYVNSMAGLVDPFGANHHNLVSGNNGTAPVCEGPLPQRMPCQNMQFGLGMGGAPPGEGTLFQDPLFVDPGAHDYNLGPDSPAIDGGFDTGEREFNGVAPVMGASETDS